MWQTGSGLAFYVNCDDCSIFSDMLLSSYHPISLIILDSWRVSLCRAGRVCGCSQVFSSWIVLKSSTVTITFTPFASRDFIIPAHPSHVCPQLSSTADNSEAGQAVSLGCWAELSFIWPRTKMSVPKTNPTVSMSETAYLAIPPGDDRRNRTGRPMPPTNPATTNDQLAISFCCWLMHSRSIK